jgi:hypothetical protein
MVSKVRGRFDNFSGAVVVAEDGTPSVTAEIAVDSVSSGNEQRDGHIKAADFFDVEKYPTATFKSTGVRAEGDKYALDGEFTLKGVTKPVTLDLAQLQDWGYTVMLNGLDRDIAYVDETHKRHCQVLGIHPTVYEPLDDGDFQTVYVDLSCPSNPSSSTPSN